MIEESKRKSILIGVIALVVILLTWTIISWSRNGTLEVSTSSNVADTNSVSIKVLRDNEETASFSLNPGETKRTRMGTGTVMVQSESGNIKSADVVQIRGFSTTKIEAPTGEQRIVQQLASDVQYCPFTVGSTTFSYACDGGQGPITKHASNSIGGSLNTKLFEGISFSNLKPIKNGLLGFYAVSGSPTDLLYIDLQKEAITIVKLPSSISSLLRLQPDIAVASASSDTFGLLFAEENKAFVFDDINDTNPTEIKPGENLKLNVAGRIAKLSFSGANESPILFVGISNDTHEGGGNGETTEEQQPQDAFVFTYDTAGKITQAIELPESLEAQGVYSLGKDFYVADQPYGFGIYHADGNNLEHVYTLVDMSSWTITDQGAYVVSNGTLYEFKPGENGQFSLRSIFSSEQITVSTVHNTSAGIVITGLPDTSSDAPLNAYVVTNQKNTASSSGSNGKTTVEPAYSGVDDLIYFGLSSFQANNLRFALGNFVATNTPTATSIAIQNPVPAPRDRYSASTTETINFDLVVDGKTLRAKLEYFDLSAIRLYLYDANSGAVVFDSQVINHKDAPSYNPEPEH